MSEPEQLAAVKAAVRDTTYPCPMSDCPNRLTLRMNVEYDEYYPIFKNPVVEGCDEHDEYLNDDTFHLNGIYAQFEERQRIATVLGLTLELEEC